MIPVENVKAAIENIDRFAAANARASIGEFQMFAQAIAVVKAFVEEAAAPKPEAAPAEPVAEVPAPVDPVPPAAE